MTTKSFLVELAKLDGLGSVTLCGCGVVSLHLAGVTLRLQANAFSQLDELVGTALQSLHFKQTIASNAASVSTMTH